MTPHPERGTCVPACPFYGRCHCGCSDPVTIATRTQSRDHVTKGEPLQYVKGHHRRTYPEDWTPQEKARAYNREWARRHPENVRATRDRENARRRERIATDPEYREHRRRLAREAKSRQRKREQEEARRAAAQRFDPAPLRERVRTCGVSRRQLAARFAELYGVRPEAAERDLERIMAEDRPLTLARADRWGSLLGLHLDNLAVAA